MRKIQAITLLLVLGILASCGGKLNSKAQKQAELEKLKQQSADLQAKIKTLEDELRDTTNANIKLVEVDTLSTQKFKHYLEIQGKIDADENVTISAKTPGAITQINVNEGDQVSKGQVLAVVDNQVIRQSIEEVKSQLDFAKNIYEKQKALWDKKIGSEVQYLTAKNNKESLEKKMATLNDQLDMSYIKSPINGVVDEVAAKIGQNAAPGVPAFRVVNLSKLMVKAEVPENFSGKVRTGDQAVIFIPDLKKEMDTKLSYVSKVVNVMSRTFTAETKLESNPMFKPNMVAVLKIVDYKADSAFVVPINVVQKSGGSAFIMVATNSGGKLIAHRKDVTVGQTYNGQAEIVSGLAAGDQIITVGFQDMNEGDQISLAK